MIRKGKESVHYLEADSTEKTFVSARGRYYLPCTILPLPLGYSRLFKLKRPR